MRSIESWVQTNFDRVTLTSNGDELKVNCPWCADTKQHLYINTAKEVFHCFKCSKGGTWFQLMQEVSGVESYAEFFHQLSEPLPHIGEFESIVERLAKRQTCHPNVCREMPDWFRKFSSGTTGRRSEIVLNYALSRLSEANIVRYGVGYCTNANERKYAWRMIIPIERGYFQARTITPEGEPKYTGPDITTEDRLFNFQALGRCKELFVAEGVISAIAIGDNAVATIGKELHEDQARRIGKSGVKKITLCYDADTVGSNGVMKAISRLSKYDLEVWVRHYKFGDPDTCSEYEDIPVAGKLGALKYELTYAKK